MRIVTREEFRRMLVFALRRLPAAVRPKSIEAVAILLTENPPLDRLEYSVREPMDFRDVGPRNRNP
jgi:hypothetical protein